MKEVKQNTVFKRILFFGIVVMLFLPMVQQFSDFKEIRPLNGSFKEIDRPSFTLESFAQGSYQEEVQNYLQQNIGFRPWLVRFYNQMQFSLYNQAKANGVIVGKENYLYEEHYIAAYLGEDFIGEENIIEKVEKLKVIKNTLSSKGIELIIVFAPGKGSFYPEFIPNKYGTEKSTTTNYEVYSKEILKSNLHFLDFNKWFIASKNTSPYPLMPKTGTHWSKYGELKAADSILHFINSLPINKKTPELLIGEIAHSSELFNTDDDIEKGMNLFFKISNQQLGYPQFNIKESEHIDAPKVLTIADSFFWGLFNMGLSSRAFNNGQFWYYNEQIYPDSYDSPLNVKDISIIDEVEKNDVILLMSTDGSLKNFAFGFIDQLYDAYFNKKLNL